MRDDYGMYFEMYDYRELRRFPWDGMGIWQADCALLGFSFRRAFHAAWVSWGF
jgi:hypothetical protein